MNNNKPQEKPAFNDYSLFEEFMVRQGYSIIYNPITRRYEYNGFSEELSPEHLPITVPIILREELNEEYSKVTKASIKRYIKLYATRNMIKEDK